MVFWVAAILLITAVALFIAAPLSEHVPGRHSLISSAESERREHEHALAVQALRELEFDHAMGKLDTGDYRVLRERLEMRALAAMDGQQKTPRHSVLGDFAPVAAWSQSLAAARTVNFCPQCGTRLDQAHNFCANCGALLSVTTTALK